MNASSGDWDAQTYDALPLPHSDWADGVLARADIGVHETVVDLGCGTGRDLERIVALRRIHASGQGHGQLFGIDTSPAMLEQATQRFASHDSAERPILRKASVTQPWPIPTPVDVIVSIAALHWVDDHAAVFHQAAASSAPNARFHAECGGFGNIAAVLELVGETSSDISLPEWNFAKPEDTANRLSQAGFEPLRVWLQPWPVELHTRERCIRFLDTIVLRGMPADVIAHVADGLPNFTVDYVRLAWSAVRQP